MPNDINDDNLKLFFKTVMQLKSEDECKCFFEDVCTVTELKSISQRIAVAKMLCENKVYSDIVSQTGASTATISRVNRSIRYGNGCYDTIFKRMNGDE